MRFPIKKKKMQTRRHEVRPESNKMADLIADLKELLPQKLVELQKPVELQLQKPSWLDIMRKKDIIERMNK